VVDLYMCIRSYKAYGLHTTLSSQEYALYKLQHVILHACESSH